MSLGVGEARKRTWKTCQLVLNPSYFWSVAYWGLSDFVDRDATIGEDVAQSLRQRGRMADAAVLLSKLPKQVGRVWRNEPASYGNLQVFLSWWSLQTHDLGSQVGTKRSSFTVQGIITLHDASKNRSESLVLKHLMCRWTRWKMMKV